MTILCKMFKQSAWNSSNSRYRCRSIFSSTIVRFISRAISKYDRHWSDSSGGGRAGGFSACAIRSDTRIFLFGGGSLWSLSVNGYLDLSLASGCPNSRFNLERFIWNFDECGWHIYNTKNKHTARERRRSKLTLQTWQTNASWGKSLLEMQAKW